MIHELFYLQNELLTEGGVAGHLSHIYDNYELPFNKIKHIIDAASAGTLEGTEKTDGFNIFMSFRDGQARCARNKTDIKNGGMTLGQLLQRPFAGGDKVKSVFIEAFETFEKAVYGLDKDDVVQIFGPQGNIYYNIEIMGPAAENVINYDTFVLAVHRGGYGYFDRNTGVLDPDVDVEANSEYLNSVLDKMQNAISNDRFNIQRTAMVKLQKMTDNTYADKAKQRLNIELKKYGLSDHHTIQDYLHANIKEILGASGGFAKYGDDFLELAVNSVLGISSLRDIPKGTPKEIREFMSQFGRSKKEAREVLKSAIWPIEDIIHDYSIQVLSGLESAYILDNKAELGRLKVEVEKAVEAIKNYDGPNAEEAQDILYKQLKKIKHIDNINTVVEGFVFEYEGHLYKFTGNYAPVNQLLGLYKWGRGGVPAMRGNESDGEVNEVGAAMTAADAMSMVPDAPESSRLLAYAVVPGGYKPPHAGHYQMVQEIAELKRSSGEYLVKEVHVLISPKPRDSTYEGKTVQVTAEDSAAIWNIYAQNNPRIKVQISPNASPVRATYEFMESMGPDTVLVVATSEKDKNDQRFAALQNWSDKHDYGVTVKTVVVDEYGENVSGTSMRQYIAMNDEELFKNNLPAHLSIQQQQQCWDIVAGDDTEEIQLQESDKGNILTRRKRQFAKRKGQKALDEVSQHVADVADEFMKKAVAGVGRELSFNDIFKGRTRLIVPLESEYTGEMKEIADWLEDTGWELDLSTGNVSRYKTSIIPAGPKAGEAVTKKQEISLGKYVDKLDSLTKSYIHEEALFSGALSTYLEEAFKSFTEETGGPLTSIIDDLYEKNHFAPMIEDMYTIFSQAERIALGIHDVKVLEKTFKKLLTQAIVDFLWPRIKGTVGGDLNKKVRLDILPDEPVIGDPCNLQRALRNMKDARIEREGPLGFTFLEKNVLKMVMMDTTHNYDSRTLGDQYNTNFRAADFFGEAINSAEPLKNSFTKLRKIYDQVTDMHEARAEDRPWFLNDIIEKQTEGKRDFKQWSKFWNENSEFYRKNPTYGKESKQTLIVSRHPIDVLRMSDWDAVKSCHSEGAGYFKCAVAESQGHGLVAYVVDNDQVPDDPKIMDVASEFQTGEIFRDRDRNVGSITPLARMRARKYVKDASNAVKEYGATSVPVTKGVVTFDYPRTRIGSLTPQKYLDKFGQKDSGIAAGTIPRMVKIRGTLVAAFFHARTSELTFDIQSPQVVVGEESLPLDQYTINFENNLIESWDEGEAKVHMDSVGDAIESYELALPELRTYGNNFPKMLETFTNWLYEKQITTILAKEGYADEDELREKKIPTKYFSRYGGSYIDSSDGQIFSEFFNDSDYNRADFARPETDDIEYEDFDDPILRELEELDRNCNEIIRRYDDIWGDFGFEYNDMDDWYIWGRLSMRVPRSQIAKFLGVEENALNFKKFDIAENYRGLSDPEARLRSETNRNIREVVDKILYDYDVYETNISVESGFILIDIEPEGREIDEWYDFFESTGNDLDERYEELLADISNALYENEIVTLIDESSTSFYDEFIKSLPLTKFEIDKQGSELVIGKTLQLGEIFLIPPDVSAPPVPNDNIALFFEKFIEYIYHFFVKQVGGVANADQGSLPLNESVDLGKIAPLEVRLVNDWNHIDTADESVSNPTYNIFPYKRTSRICPSLITYSAMTKVDSDYHDDSAELQIIKVAPKTIPLFANLEISIGRGSFIKAPETMRNVFKFLVWLDQTDFKEFREVCHKYIEFLNAVAIRELHQILPSFTPIYKAVHEKPNETLLSLGEGRMRWDQQEMTEEMFLSLFALYKNFANLKITDTALNISKTNLKQIVDFFHNPATQTLPNNKLVDFARGQRLNKLQERLTKREDLIPGGKADKKNPSDFDKTQLKKGAKVEMEHTNDLQMAIEIAMDHLTEDPKYYDHLADMEDKYVKESFMKMATILKDGQTKKGADWALYRLEPALKNHEYVLGVYLSSNVHYDKRGRTKGNHFIYFYPSDENGKQLSTDPIISPIEGVNTSYVLINNFGYEISKGLNEMSGMGAGAVTGVGTTPDNEWTKKSEWTLEGVKNV